MPKKYCTCYRYNHYIASR